MNSDLLNKLKNTQEMVADQHDGSYKLMRATVNAYRSVEKSVLDYKDLNAVYLMSVGTWKHGVQVKKRVIDESHLPDEQKTALKSLLDEIQAKAARGEYSNRVTPKDGVFGMFGTGFNSFKGKTNDESVRSFIKMCVDICDMNDDDEIYTRVEQALNNHYRGMGAASASMVLHCLKPNTFPILNSNMGSEDIFAALGIKLKRKGTIDTYADNCRAIKAFRDSNLPFKNYRILDLAAQELNKEDNETGIENDKEVNLPVATFNKNTILYGPPGTGKTYQTINYAVAIIEGRPLNAVMAEEYADVLKRYNGYKEAGYIEFTTFHQSFGYEEFIEGIKPILYSEDEEEDTTSISYKIEDGIFKAFCDRAEMPVIEKNNDFGFSEHPTVWKVSLAKTGDNPVRKDCMENGYIRIGWDEYGPDITEETDYYLGGKNVLNAFINRMEVGDIVLSCFSQRTVDAIGVVEGEYEWREEFEDYQRIRKVKWLVKGINYDIVEMNHDTVMTLSTVYRMRLPVADVIKILNENSVGEVITTEAPKNCVFIIDEINRGNISKIFGELITLIEPSKRLGQPEAMKAKLPYSRKLFGVPDNVYIIGTMNTADRSIALIDTALRRRFNFVEMQPDNDVLKGIEVEGVSIPDMLNKINRRIEVLRDREHTIGHAYFIDLKNEPTLDRLACIFEHNIIPLLQEYFYEDYNKIRSVLGDSGKNFEEQFVHEKQNDYEELFREVDSDFDEMPAYEINLVALKNINSYRNI